MPSYKRKSAFNYSRKSRRIAKYGKYAKPAGAMVRYGYGKGRGTKKILAPRFVNPFTRDYELVQLKYRQNISLNPNVDTIGAGGANTWEFRFNSLFDPDQTGTGNQPMYFDNYAQLYGRYKVSFAKIKATVVNHSVNTATWNGTTVLQQPNYSYKLAILRDASGISEINGSSLDALITQDSTNVKWRYVGPQLNGKLPSITMKCAPHKQRGLAYNDDTLQADVGSNPTGVVNGAVIITSADGQTDPPSVNLVVEMTFYVKFFDRKNNQAVN